MGKAKVTPPKAEANPAPARHGYNLRNRDDLKAKREKAVAEAAPQASKTEKKGKKRSTSSNKAGGSKRHKTTKKAADPDPDYLPRGAAASPRNAEESPSEHDDDIPPPPGRHNYNLRDRKALEEKRRYAYPPASASSSDEMVYEPQERKVTATFEDLKGMDEIQEELKNTLIWPFSNVRNAGLLNMDIPKGVLLTGVPGIGKTALADAIVNEIRANGKSVHYLQETGACLSKYVGESEKKLRQLFQEAREKAPTVIFLDEIDGLGRMRQEGPSNGAMHTILTTLLTELNTLTAGSVLLLAATNCPRLCDPALLRKGRFDLTIDLPLPGPAARVDILEHYFGKKEITLTRPVMTKIVDQTDRSTGSDLKSLVASIYQNVVRRVFPGGSWRGMTETEIRSRKADLQKIEFERDVKPKLSGSSQASRGMALVEE